MSRAADYLPEYSKHYNTVEIDSWFYKIPDPAEAEDYTSKVGEDFQFTCKVTNRLTLTHLRGSKNRPPEENPEFLSPELFIDFLKSTEPVHSKLGCIMFEFEYLNKQKMGSSGIFIKKAEAFIRQIPRDIPVAFEIRNPNYLSSEYFSFLRENNIGHVFSEKIYMPPITEVYKRFGSLLAPHTIIRLLGGERRAIELLTNNTWDRIVQPKEELINIIQMTQDLYSGGKILSINVNNHYEGCAPLTIKKIQAMLN